MAKNTHNTDSRTYCSDIYGVKQIGVENWLQTHNTPITGKDYSEIHGVILEIYKGLFCDCSKGVELYWLGVANFKIVNVITDNVFNQLRFDCLKAQGMEHVASNKIITIDEFNNWPVNNIQMKFDIPEPMFTFRVKNVLKKARSIAEEIKTAHKFGKNQKVFRVGSLSNEMRQYCQELELCPLNFDRFSFIKPFHTNYYECTDIESRVHDFISIIATTYSFLKKDRLEACSKETLNILQKSFHFIRTNSMALEKGEKRNFLSIANGSPINRAVVAACRLADREVIGFVHGNCFATMRPNEERIYHDSISIVSTTVASSKGEAELTSKVASSVSDNIKTSKISYPNESMHKITFDRLQQEASVDKVKTIMIVGFPMTPYYYASCKHLYSLSMLRLEINLIKALKKARYKVIYKAHPDRLNEISNVFNHYVDGVIVEPFESTYLIADCLLFPHFGTTTFGFALMTKTPIVLIDHVENNDVFDDPMQLIRKRCGIVNASTNEYDETTFEESELLFAVQNSVTKMDYEVVEKYAL